MVARCRLCDVEVFPLDQCDPDWVLGEGSVTDAVHGLLAETARTLLDLCSAVDGRAGFSGTGLEFHRLPGRDGYPSRTTLVGAVTASDGTLFEAELRPESDGFVVDAGIAVPCDGGVDCGQHRILDLPARHERTPADAARALLTAARDLRACALAHPLAHWREQDVLAGHG